MSSSSAAFFAENFAGTVSVFVGAPGTAKTPLTNTASAGGLAFGGGCFWVAGAARPSSAFCLASSESYCCSTGLMLITTNSHDVEAILCSRKARHGIIQVRIARTGAGDKLCHGDRSVPQRFHACALLLVWLRGALDRPHEPIGGSRRRLRACWRAPVDGSLPVSLAGTRCKSRRFQL